MPCCDFCNNIGIVEKFDRKLWNMKYYYLCSRCLSIAYEDWNYELESDRLKEMW